MVGVHVTQFKHQLTLQDQLEVNKDITTATSHHNDIMDNKPSGRAEHDPLVAGDACAVPRPLRPLQLAQARTHNLPHIHQPHKVGSCGLLSIIYYIFPKLLLDSFFKFSLDSCVFRRPLDRLVSHYYFLR